MVLTYLGIGIGQLMLNLSGAAGDAPFFTAGILLALCLVPVSLTTAISPAMPRTTRLSLWTLLRKTPLGILGCFSAGMISSSFYAMGPVFGHTIGLTVAQISLFMSAAVFGGLALQWTIGSFSDRFDRTLVLPAVAVLIVLASLLVMATSGVGFPILLVSMMLFGGVGFSLYPVAVARGHDLFEPDQVVAVSSGLLLSYGLGASIGPVLAAASIRTVGNPCGLFAFTGAVAGLYAVLSAWLRTLESVAIVPVADQGTFMPMKRTSAVAMVIDPRAEPDTETEEVPESGL
jgi:MFS family permease